MHINIEPITYSLMRIFRSSFGGIYTSIVMKECITMSGQHSNLRKAISSRGLVTFEIDLWHEELGKHRTVKGSDPHFVTRVATIQLDTWKDQWERQQVVAA